MSPEPKAEPVRMCSICRERFPKKELERYTLDGEGILQADANKTAPGRGWYVCRKEGCLKKFLKYRPAKRRAGKTS